MDNGKLVIESLYRILRVLLALDDKTCVSAVISTLLLWEHQVANRLPGWDMFREHASVGNEQASEMIMSVLAEATATHTRQNEFEHMRNMYSRVKTYMRAQDDFHTDSSSSPLYQWGAKYNAGPPREDQIAAASQFFKAFIRSVRFGQMVGIDSSCLAGPVSRKLHDSVKVGVAVGERFTDKSLEGVLEKKLENLALRIDEHWLSEEDVSTFPKPNYASSLSEDSQVGSSSDDQHSEDAGAAPDACHHSPSVSDASSYDDTGVFQQFAEHPDFQGSGKDENEDDQDGDSAGDMEAEAEANLESENEEDGYAEEAEITEPEPPHSATDVRAGQFQAEAQSDRRAKWKAQISVDPVNVIPGGRSSRKRKQTDLGCVVSNSSSFVTRNRAK